MGLCPKIPEYLSVWLGSPVPTLDDEAVGGLEDQEAPGDQEGLVDLEGHARHGERFQVTLRN